jgi:Xaa-Pro aminopeptidase
MDQKLFIKNRKKFTDLMKDNTIAVFYSNTFIRDTVDQFYPFSVDRNFFYLTGIERENMVLLLSKVDGLVEETLFIPPVDEMYEKWHALFMREDEAIDKSGIQNIDYIEKFSQSLFKKISISQDIKSIYLFSYIAEENDYESQYIKLSKLILNQFPHMNILNSLDILSKIRPCKEDQEVKEIEKAIDLTNGGLNYVMDNLKPGIWEHEITAHFQYYLALNKSKSRFRTIVASAGNAMILHYNAAKRQTQENDLVLMDLGAFSNWYVSDITRTYPVSGKFTQRQKDIYNIVLEAQQVAMETMKSGVYEKDVNDTVINYYAKELKKIKLIKLDEDVKKYFYHGVGHNIGLDLHDLKNEKLILQEGNVFTVEPGLYIKEENLGIRIEDNVLVTKDGVVNLSKDIIKEIKDIENYMK